MTDDALFDIKNTIEIKTSQGLFRECYYYTLKKYNILCKFSVSDETVMSDKNMTDIMGFIISKNILHSEINTEKNKFSFSIEITISDENGNRIDHSEVSHKLFDTLLYKTVSSTGKKKLIAQEYKVTHEVYLDGVKFESEDEIFECLDKEREEFKAELTRKRNIIKSYL